MNQDWIFAEVRHKGLNRKDLNKEYFYDILYEKLGAFAYEILFVVFRPVTDRILGFLQKER